MITRRDFLKAGLKTGLILPALCSRGHAIVDPYHFGGFNPTQIPNLVAWWEADSGVTPGTDGTDVTSWADTVSSLAATGATGTRTFRANSVNSRPSVESGNDDSLRTADISPLISGSSVMIGVVFKTTSSSIQYIFRQVGDVLSTVQSLLPGASTIYWQLDANNMAECWGGGVASNSYHCAIFARNGGTYEVWLNGWKIGHLVPGGTQAPSGSHPLDLFGGGTGAALRGNGVATLIANSYSAANLTKLWNYYHDKYALTVNDSSKYVIFDGASITFGFRSTAITGSPSNTCLATLGIPGWIGCNFGITGQTVATMVSNSPAKVDPLIRAGRTAYIIAGDNGTNDLAGGDSAASILSNIYALADGRRSAGAKVALGTIYPFGSDSTQESRRQTINADIRANWSSHADVLVDHASDTTMFPTDTQSDCSNATYYYGDLVHLIDAGSVRKGNIDAAAIATITF